MSAVIGYSDRMPRNLPAAHEPGVLEDLVAAYGSGMSIRNLAFARGMSYGAMHRRLKEAEARGMIAIRGRGARGGAASTATER